MVVETSGQITKIEVRNPPKPVVSLYIGMQYDTNIFIKVEALTAATDKALQEERIQNHSLQIRTKLFQYGEKVGWNEYIALFHKTQFCDLCTAFIVFMY